MPLAEKGRLRVRVLEEILPLKMLPAVPVERVVTTVVPRLMVVEVPIMESLPSPVPKERPVPKDRLPKVVVPMPPLVTCRIPETSEEFKLMAPLNREPPEVDLTGRAEERFVMVVEPKVLTEKRVEPDELATFKTSNPGTVDVPTTDKVALGVDVPMPKEPLALRMAKVTPVEEVILNGSKVPLPWTLKEMVELVALTPATVPLSLITPLAVVVPTPV